MRNVIGRYSVFSSQFDFAAIEVEAYNPTAVGLEDLTGQQADQAKANDGNAFTKSRADESHSFKSDRGDDGEAGACVIDLIWYAGTEVGRNAYHFSVVAV